MLDEEKKDTRHEREKLKETKQGHNRETRKVRRYQTQGKKNQSETE
jgi:hypothetical protein